MQQIKSNPEALQRAKIMAEILNSAEEVLINLKGRWLDEREYEDFNDYKEPITKAVLEKAPEGSKVIKITKTFNITMEIPNFPYNPIIYVNSVYGWKSK